MEKDTEGVRSRPHLQERNLTRAERSVSKEENNRRKPEKKKKGLDMDKSRKKTASEPIRRTGGG